MINNDLYGNLRLYLRRAPPRRHCGGTGRPPGHRLSPAAKSIGRIKIIKRIESNVAVCMMVDSRSLAVEEPIRVELMS